MIDKTKIPAKLLPLLEEKLKGRMDEIDFPPPVFETINTMLLEY